MFHETRTEEMCICPVRPVTPEPPDVNRSPAPKSNSTPQAFKTKLVRFSLRQGDSWRAAAFFLVPLDFDEDQIEAAATPIAEALGQHEWKSTGSVEGLVCDLHLVTTPDSRDQNNDDPIMAAIDRCIRSALEEATK